MKRERGNLPYLEISCAANIVMKLYCCHISKFQAIISKGQRNSTATYLGGRWRGCLVQENIGCFPRPMTRVMMMVVVSRDSHRRSDAKADAATINYKLCCRQIGGSMLQEDREYWRQSEGSKDRSPELWLGYAVCTDIENNTFALWGPKESNS